MVNKLKIRKRLKAKKPAFLRQEWFRMGNQRKKWLKWRTPRGNQSKLRMHIKGKGFMPHPGYGSPAEVRGLHPSGLADVLVYNTQQLKQLDPKLHAARIGSEVGRKKRIEMEKAAVELKIRILNPRKLLEKEAKTK